MMQHILNCTVSDLAGRFSLLYVWMNKTASGYKSGNSALTNGKFNIFTTKLEVFFFSNLHSQYFYLKGGFMMDHSRLVSFAKSVKFQS